MSDDLDLVTGLTQKEQKNVFLWVSTLSISLIVDIFQDAVRRTYQIKHERPEMPGKETKFCGFILAARDAGWDTVKGKNYRVAGEKQFKDFDRIRETAITEMVRKTRPPILRRKVIAYWPEIKQIRSTGAGFGPISEYLMKKRKIKVSVRYLRQLWKEEEER